MSPSDPTPFLCLSLGSRRPLVLLDPLVDHFRSKGSKLVSSPLSSRLTPRDWSARRETRPNLPQGGLHTGRPCSLTSENPSIPVLTPTLINSPPVSPPPTRDLDSDHRNVLQVSLCVCVCLFRSIAAFVSDPSRQWSIPRDSFGSPWTSTFSLLPRRGSRKPRSWWVVCGPKVCRPEVRTLYYLRTTKFVVQIPVNNVPGVL